MVEDSGGQFGSAGRLAEVADGTRDRLYLLGPRRIGMQIDADADHKRAYRAGFALDGRFREAVSYTHLDVYKRQVHGRAYPAFCHGADGALAGGHGHL